LDEEGVVGAWEEEEAVAVVMEIMMIMVWWWTVDSTLRGWRECRRWEEG
jgi:hypothetical protein